MKESSDTIAVICTIALIVLIAGMIIFDVFWLHEIFVSNKNIKEELKLSEHNDEVTLTFGNDVGDFFYQNEKGEWVSEDGKVVPMPTIAFGNPGMPGFYEVEETGLEHYDKNPSIKGNIKFIPNVKEEDIIPYEEQIKSWNESEINIENDIVPLEEK